MKTTTTSKESAPGTTVPQMKIEWWPIDRPIPYKRNARNQDGVDHTEPLRMIDHCVLIANCSKEVPVIGPEDAPCANRFAVLIEKLLFLRQKVQAAVRLNFLPRHK